MNNNTVAEPTGRDVVFTAPLYRVELLPEPQEVATPEGLKLSFSYVVRNMVTGIDETFSQFLPSAIEQATRFSERLEELLDTDIIDTEVKEGNVVNLNTTKES